MRIEGPVACPTPTGEPAGEKIAPDGFASLFTDVLDCFRVLFAGSLPEGDATCSETPAATAQSAGPSRIAPTTASFPPAKPEKTATGLSTIQTDDMTSGQERREVSGACAVQTLVVPVGTPFQPAAAECSASTKPDQDVVVPAAPQTADGGHEVFAISPSRTPAGVTQQANISGFAVDPQCCATVNESVTARRGETEDCDNSPASEPDARDPGPGSRSVEQRHGITNLEGSSPAVSKEAQSTPPVGATDIALMIAVDVPQSDGPTGSDGKTAVVAPFPAPSIAGLPLTGGTERKVVWPVISATPWISPKGGNIAKSNTNQAGDQTAKSEATRESKAAPGLSDAYTTAIRSSDSAVRTVDPNVDEHRMNPDFPAQKLQEKAAASAPGQPSERPASGGRAESRPETTEFKADARVMSQPDSAARPAVAFRIGAAADPAAPQVDSERVLSGRGRLQTIGEGGERESSAVSSLTGAPREPQISPQATAGVRDVKAPAFVFEVAERISAVAAGGRGEVTVQLKPDQFGRMNIVAESGTSGILARITTESAALKQYLENNLPVLHQALQEQGLKVERIDVLVQEGLLQQQSTNQWQHNFGHAPGGHESDGNSKPAVSAPGRPAQFADEVTLDAISLGALHPHSTFHTVA